MTRSAPAVYTGSVGAAANCLNSLGPALRTAITSYQVSAVQQWDENSAINTTPGTNYQIRFHSPGDRSLGSGGNVGDADVYIDVLQASATNYALIAYQGASASRPAVNTTGVSMGGSGTAYTWYVFIDNYEIVIVVVSGGNIAILAAGSLVRSEQVEGGGVARVSVLNNGTGTVVYSVDRDVSSKIFVGNPIWLVDGTKAEVGTVTAITSNTITVSGIVTGGYAAGSLIGRDPSPNYSWQTATAAAPSPIGTTGFTATRDDGGYTGSSNGAHGFTFRTIYQDATAANIESDQDPNPDGTYRMAMFQHCGSTTPHRDMRGASNIMAFVTQGAQSQGDKMLLNGDSTKPFTVFPAVATGNFCTCFRGV